MQQRTKIALTATLITVSPVLMAAVVLLAPVNLKRAFLGVAGLVVGGVKDDVGVVATVSIVSLAILWLVIIARTIYEASAECTANEVSRRDDPSPASPNP